ncbi:MAG: ribonuclease P protein component [Cyclobacteriaceae bacterium]|nr:ribonuclease P protein component [Cyclobacteriaceae bacterium]
MGLQSLSKAERLRGKSAVENLFQHADTISVPPFRVKVQRNPDAAAGHQVLFTVSKRYIPKATQRNRVKRLMREAYRLNKSQLNELPSLRIAYIYQSGKVPALAELSEAMIQVFGRIKSYVEKS